MHATQASFVGNVDWVPTELKLQLMDEYNGVDSVSNEIYDGGDGDDDGDDYRRRQ